MFNKEYTGEDIFLQMGENLKKNAMDKIAKKKESRVEAVNLLKKASENFKQIGLEQESLAISRLAQYAETDHSFDDIRDEIDSEPVKITDDEFGYNYDPDNFEDEDEEFFYDKLMEDPDVAGEVKLDIDEESDEDEDEVPDLTHLFPGGR
jgi:hypothetical protein